jgi:AraC-like DNA-binding protein
MLDFSLHPVHPFLQRFVSTYCIMHLNQDEALSTLFTGKTDSVLLFNIGRSSNNISIAFSLPNNPKKTFTFYSHESYLGGLLNQPLSSLMTGNTRILCVVLTPFGVHNLIQENTASVLNDGFSMETLGLHKPLEYLIDKLQQVNNNHEALALVQNHFLHYFSHLDIPFSVKDMSPVVNYISQRNGVVKVKQLEEKFRVSRRWLEKQFSVQVGLSPKEFARIKRFTALLGQATMSNPASKQSNRAVSWATFLEDFGYYDQSHLIRDFKEFTGQTPAQYIKTTPYGLNNVFLKTLE